MCTASLWARRRVEIPRKRPGGADALDEGADLSAGSAPRSPRPSARSWRADRYCSTGPSSSCPGAAASPLAVSIISRVRAFVVPPVGLATSVRRAPSAVMWSRFSLLNASDVTIWRGMPLRGAHEGERHARASARVLDHRTTRPQPSVRLGRLDHRERHAVLHAPRRVLVFQLEQNPGAPLRDHVLEWNEPRSADGVEHRHFHSVIPIDRGTGRRVQSRSGLIFRPAALSSIRAARRRSRVDSRFALMIQWVTCCDSREAVTASRPRLPRPTEAGPCSHPTPAAPASTRRPCAGRARSHRWSRASALRTSSRGPSWAAPRIWRPCRAPRSVSASTPSSPSPVGPRLSAVSAWSASL